VVDPATMKMAGVRTQDGQRADARMLRDGSFPRAARCAQARTRPWPSGD
jgi:hypothetical protein